MKKAAKLTVKKNAATKKTATKKNARKALDAKETTPPRLKQMRLSLTTAPAKPQNAEPVQTQDADPSKKPRRDVPHCNTLDGKGWIQNSISVWSDIRKSAEEMRLKHPAMFPGMLVERLINTFLRPEGTTILDPFCGSGSTVVAAERLGKTGIGIELSSEYVELARDRIESVAEVQPPKSVIHEGSVTDLVEFVKPDSVDLCITSPPYWNILNQKRTADYKSVRHYGNLDGDLGTIDDYNEFLDSLKTVFADVLQVLKPGAYCCVIVMDLRKKDRFFPFHSDLAARLQDVGYIFDDLIIWNRQTEYNNLRPLGYPAVFRVNKVHEFVVLLQKPRLKKKK